MNEKVITIIDEKEKEVMKKLHFKINTFYELEMSLSQSEFTTSEVDEIKSKLNKDLHECEKQIQNWWNSILKKYKIGSNIDVSKLRLVFNSNKIIL